MGGTLDIGRIDLMPYTRPERYANHWLQGTTILPLNCSGDTHVFGCQHAEACKCGKATRKVEPRVCPHCKKAHD